MKKLFTILLVALMALTLVGCGSKDTATDEGTASDAKVVAVVTDVGQLNDGGFNQGTWEGAKQFAEEAGLTYQYYQPANGSDATDDDRIAAMRLAIENGAEIIVTPGFLQAAAITTVATESPDVKFVFVDGWPLGLDNVTAISYHEEESGFFAGYAAVKDGYTKLGGTFGGAGTNAACNRFSYGYVQGIDAAAKELGINVEVNISFLYGSAFSASNELQTQIAGWYNAGTEVVFSCGGSMLNSVLAAANEVAGSKVIGVDTDQSAIDEKIITSAFKGLTPSVKLVLNSWKDGKWDTELANNLSNLGVNEDSTGLPTASGSWRFNSFTVAEYEEVLAKVATGAVVISTDCADMSTAAAWDSLTLTNTTLNLEY